MKNIQVDCTFLNDLEKTFYSILKPQPLLRAKLVSVNEDFAKELGLTNNDIYSPEFVKLINGESFFKGSTPHANAYSGHQFGYFVPNLGDGRALNLGKIKNYYLQVKGSGTTPYSRNGDGRAVLRSSIREYLISEAMQGLGIPTTRALALINSDSKVLREYEQENAAIVLRASDSWIRFGSFEYAYIQKEKQKVLSSLADFVIQEHFVHLKNLNNKYEEMFFCVVDKTIELLALWQSIGFMHGVINTDNMSILGLTIDYGPYAMMEEFDKGFICNLSDHEGRYSFENQPFITQWNLSVLAKVLSPIANHEMMEKYNDSFIERFKERYFCLMKEKLGLYNTNIDDKKLILQLFNAMQDDKIDYTSFFYRLSKGNYDLFTTPKISSWLEDYKLRLESEDLPEDRRKEQMLKINPKYILRNYMLQDAIDAAENGDFTLVNDFLEIAHNPYGEFKKYEHYTKPKPEFEPLKCSCSS